MNNNELMLANRTKDNLLEKMYEYLGENKLHKADLPHSDIYYIREALHERVGKWFTFKQVEMAVNLHEQRYPTLEVS
jgi:hypothetical protein